MTSSLVVTRSSEHAMSSASFSDGVAKPVRWSRSGSLSHSCSWLYDDRDTPHRPTLVLISFVVIDAALVTAWAVARRARGPPC